MGNSLAPQPSEKKVTIDDFDFVRLVGKGAFGKVWQVRHKDTGQLYAMKVLDKKTVVEQNLVEHTVLERDVMLMCRNPFIINLYYSFQTSDSLYFILDFVGGGSLFTCLRDHPNGYFPEAQARFYAAEILLGIEELHRNEIVYRDLKLENILLGTDGHIVLTDFGLSIKLQNKDEKCHSFSGTAIYIAPEVLLGEGHDKTVDWWSYGVVLHLLLTGEPPFWSENRRELFEMIIVHDVIIDDPLLSPQSRDLISKLLNRDVGARLGCAQGAIEIKKHAFFSGINWNNVYRKKLKPPLVPSEFLLTTRNTPVAVPSKPKSPSEEGSSNSGEQVNLDQFQGFSFARPSEKSATVEGVAALNKFTKATKATTPFGKKSNKSKKGKRGSPLERLNLEKIIEVKDRDALTKSSNDLPTTPKKLELLREQAARDNRNRRFISVGESVSKSGNTTVNTNETNDLCSSVDNVEIRHKKLKKEAFERYRFSTGTINESSLDKQSGNASPRRSVAFHEPRFE